MAVFEIEYRCHGYTLADAFRLDPRWGRRIFTVDGDAIGVTDMQAWRDQRLAPTARFLVIGPPWPTADVPEAVLQVRDVLNVEARAAGAPFIDPLGDGWFVGRPDLIGPDGVHPTDAGHEYLAGKIAPLIRTQLPR